MSKALLHTVTFTLLAAVTGACGEPETEAPPEQAQPQVVYGVAPAAVGGTPSAITLTPAMGAGSAGAAAPAGQDPPVMDQLGLVFTPPTLFVRVGEPVVFTNSETLVHNVRLTVTDTDSTVFDVETDPGARAEFVFERGGGYDVTCDHHPGMRAFIYATDAPYAVFADNTGNFLIPDVPPGTYTLSVWSVDPDLRAERRLEVSSPSTEVNLVAP